MYTSDFWDAAARSGAFFFLKSLKKFAKVFQQFFNKNVGVLTIFISLNLKVLLKLISMVNLKQVFPVDPTRYSS